MQTWVLVVDTTLSLVIGNASNFCCEGTTTLIQVISDPRYFECMGHVPIVGFKSFIYSQLVIVAANVGRQVLLVADHTYVHS